MGGMPDMPAQPKEKSTYTYEGDELVSSKEVQGDTVITKQIPKKEELANKKRREEELVAAEQAMKDFLPTLNSVDPQLLKDIEQQAQQMSATAGESLNKSYQSQLEQLANTANARFGSTQNAYYDKQQAELNKILAQQQSRLAQDIEGRKSELKQQELANRQNWYNNMGNYTNNLRQGINDFRDQQARQYNNTMQASQMSNNFDAQNYATEMQGYQAQLQYKAASNPFSMMFSDARLKENIRPSDSVLDRLDDVNVWDYNYQGMGTPQTGFIAQELEQAFPEAVAEMPDGTKMINQGALVPIMLKAIKELREKVGG